MNNFKSPLYLVSFKSAICNYEIYINDLPAYSHLEGGSVSSQIPINHWIFESGEQEVKVRVLPLKGEIDFREDSFIEIKIFSYDSSTTNYGDIVESFNFSVENLYDLKIPVVEKRDFFIAEVPFILKKWNDFDEIKEKKGEIILFYKAMYQLFKEKDIQKIYNLLKFRFDQIDEATYSKESDNFEGLSKMLFRLKEGDFELMDFPTEPMLKIYDNKKICNLTRGNNDPILLFKNKNNNEFSFPLLIGFEKSEPIVVR
ncbi:hypothetical protein FIA58_018140 [Flavobacterium jejuense]|uniref:Uncharacterized protein n=1 Tax=Flavobacterium jejuense TaxID=1544455 RepID=A0ABX0IUL0_9FLAO|nr:hypothetical protein [Flavobacterium jejuense]NHN27605.1 hypothetical protein [Flavobacterium jejuense]